MNSLLPLLATIPQAAMAADTVVMVPARDAVDLVIAIAAGCVAATFFGILLLIAGVIVEARKASRAVADIRKRIAVDPAIESLRGAASNVESITGTLRGEVAHLSTSVSHLSDRLQQASDRMEERIEAFNALLEVVQGEAEEAFVDSASRARGFRAGLERLRAGRTPDRDTGRSADRAVPRDTPLGTPREGADPGPPGIPLRSDLPSAAEPSKEEGER